MPDIHNIVSRASFKADLARAPRDIQNAAQRALALLLQNPKAKSLRLHSLTGYDKPTIWKIDVFANHSWQITFELEGDVATLLRIGTHKDIDRRPR